MRRPPLPAVLACMLVAHGCGCGAPHEASRGPGTPAPPSEPPTDPGRGAAAYDVHEWGLVRAVPGDLLVAGAVAPPIRTEVLAVDKPVLYFHADRALRLSSVRVDADGAIVEAWPPPGPRTGLASRLDWIDVALDPTGACAPSPLPAASDPACATLPAGDFCETPSLATVRVPGSACVRVAGYTDSLLFYRTRSRSFTPPLRYQRRQVHEDVDVTNEGDAPLPGWIVRIHRDGGRVRTQLARPPAPHQSIVIGHDFDAGADPGRRGVRETMTEIGLTGGEIDAFLRAWDQTLFAGPAATTDEDSLPADRTSTDELSADGEPAPQETFLYFLSAADCDRLARLSFTPHPRRVSRAIAVWSVLGATGASR